MTKTQNGILRDPARFTRDQIWILTEEDSATSKLWVDGRLLQKRVQKCPKDGWSIEQIPTLELCKMV